MRRPDETGGGPVVVELGAPPADVWAVLVDVERMPTWSPSVTSVRLLDPAPLHVGSRARLRQPRLLPAVWRVTELEPGRSFTWESRAPGVVTTGRHALEPAAGGTRVTLGVEHAGPLAPLVRLLAGRLTARYVRQEADGLAARVAQG